MCKETESLICWCELLAMCWLVSLLLSNSIVDKLPLSITCHYLRYGYGAFVWQQRTFWKVWIWPDGNGPHSAAATKNQHRVAQKRSAWDKGMEINSVCGTFETTPKREISKDMFRIYTITKIGMTLSSRHWGRIRTILFIGIKRAIFRKANYQKKWL